MNSTKRNGVDIQVAFTLASRRLHAKHTIETGAAVPEDVAPMQPGMRLIIRHYTKQTLRRIAHHSLRVARPLTRPLLFRLRNYFTAAIRQEMLEEFSKLQKIQYQQHQQIVLEFQRLANSAKIQTRLSQKIFSSQHSLEGLQQQLDRIEQKSLGNNIPVADATPGEHVDNTRLARGEDA